MLVAEMLGGYMAGVTVSGVLWAIFQNNAGGAWDNAKKSFEAGVEINGVMTYKGSEAHKAAVTGDTVGDPFKDTSGPSMNILIKLTCLIGLVIAPILGNHVSTDTHTTEVTTEVLIQYDEYGDPITKETIISPQISELEGIWILDGTHTYVDFSIRHILAPSKGNFEKVTGSVNFSQENPSMQIEIDANSISTRNEKRDNHLRSDEMLHVEKYPTITFVSNSITQSESGCVAKGELTLMGVTKSVELPFKYFGKEENAYKMPTASFAGEIIINKNEYGLTYGGKILGEVVTIAFSIEMNPPAPSEEDATK